MQHSSPQLTLGLRLRDEATFANFYAGKNAEIVTNLQNAASRQGERQIYLCGGNGLGHSHLLQACCHYAQQQHLSSVYLPFNTLLSLKPEVLNGLETLAVICLDDIHLLAGHAAWEEAVFHLFNRVYERGGTLIMAAHGLPKEIQLTLPDLVSRLTWGVVFQLHHLTDEEKLAMLTMRAAERGMNLANEVGKYILTHYPRHIGNLFAVLDVLDKASLAAQRKLTIPFVKEVLGVVHGAN